MEPENLPARLGLGEVYSKMTRNDLAVTEFLKAESIKPDDTELLFKIALEYWYDQKIKKAANYYQKILAIEPNHMQTHLNLISVYEKLKDWEKALEEIEIMFQPLALKILAVGVPTDGSVLVICDIENGVSSQKSITPVFMLLSMLSSPEFFTQKSQPSRCSSPPPPTGCTE